MLDGAVVGIVFLIGSGEVSLDVWLGTSVLAALAYLADALFVEVLFRVHQI